MPSYRLKASKQATQAAQSLLQAADQMSNVQGPMVKEIIQALQDGAEMASALAQRIELERART